MGLVMVYEPIPLSSIRLLRSIFFRVWLIYLMLTKVPFIKSGSS